MIDLPLAVDYQSSILGLFSSIINLLHFSGPKPSSLSNLIHAMADKHHITIRKTASVV